MKVKNSFGDVYKEYAKFWNAEKNKISPYEVKYNDDNFYFFKCDKCDYEFKRNLKRIRELPFKHMCLNDRENIIKEQLEDKATRQQIAFRVAYNQVFDKYNGDWELIEYRAKNRPCLLKHSCGKIKKITRFNNVLKSNVVCECEK